jgi:single-strand DNA-binding protein
VANFTLASTPRAFNKETKAWEDGEALFLNCTVWKDMAEHVAETLNKGARVIATGRLAQRSYLNNEGEKRYSMELEVEEVGPSLRFAAVKSQDDAPQWAAADPGDPWGGSGSDNF